MPRKKNKENIPSSNMELRCLEKGTTVRQKVPGQRGVGGLAPRKVLSTRISNRLRRPSRYDMIRKRRWEALQQAARQLQEEEDDDDKSSSTLSDNPPSPDSTSVPVDEQSSVQLSDSSTRPGDIPNLSKNSSTPCNEDPSKSSSESSQ